MIMIIIIIFIIIIIVINIMIIFIIIFIMCTIFASFTFVCSTDIVYAALDHLGSRYIKSICYWFNGSRQLCLEKASPHTLGKQVTCIYVTT